MKISELKRIAKENDYKYKFDQQHELRHRANGNYIAISDDYVNRIWCENCVCCTDEDFNMMKAAVAFAETPPEDREEEKKFYLKHRWMKPRPIDKNYLNLWIGTNEYWLDCKNETEDVQTQFTKKEIEEIKEKFNTDLADFEEVEVEE